MLKLWVDGGAGVQRLAEAALIGRALRRQSQCVRKVSPLSAAMKYRDAAVRANVTERHP